MLLQLLHVIHLLHILELLHLLQLLHLLELLHSLHLLELHGVTLLRLEAGHGTGVSGHFMGSYMRYPRTCCWSAMNSFPFGLNFAFCRQILAYFDELYQQIHGYLPLTRYFDGNRKKQRVCVMSTLYHDGRRNRSLATNSLELRPLLREQALDSDFNSCKGIRSWRYY